MSKDKNNISPLSSLAAEVHMSLLVTHQKKLTGQDITMFMMPVPREQTRNCRESYAPMKRYRGRVKNKSKLGQNLR